MLTSFNTLPHMIFQWGNDSVFLVKYGGTFCKEKFSMADRGQLFLENLWEEVPHRGLMIRLCQEGEDS